jgi:hypothetical protein
LDIDNDSRNFTIKIYLGKIYYDLQDISAIVFPNLVRIIRTTSLIITVIKNMDTASLIVMVNGIVLVHYPLVNTQIFNPKITYNVVVLVKSLRSYYKQRNQ